MNSIKLTPVIKLDPLDQFKGCSGCESGVQLGSMGSSISSS
jgi:hypothetical protein